MPRTWGKIVELLVTRCGGRDMTCEQMVSTIASHVETAVGTREYRDQLHGARLRRARAIAKRQRLSPDTVAVSTGDVVQAIEAKPLLHKLKGLRYVVSKHITYLKKLGIATVVGTVPATGRSRFLLVYRINSKKFHARTAAKLIAKRRKAKKPRAKPAPRRSRSRRAGKPKTGF